MLRLYNVSANTPRRDHDLNIHLRYQTQLDRATGGASCLIHIYHFTFSPQMVKLLILAFHTRLVVGTYFTVRYRRLETCTDFSFGKLASGQLDFLVYWKPLNIHQTSQLGLGDFLYQFHKSIVSKLNNNRVLQFIGSTILQRLLPTISAAYFQLPLHKGCFYLGFS